MGQEYTRAEAQHIADQLAQVKDLTGNPVFHNVEIHDVVLYHELCLKNDVGTAIVMLHKSFKDELVYLNPPY